jgi:hypothetical protein
MRTRSRFLVTPFLLASFLSFLGAIASPQGTRNDGHRPVKLSEQTEILGKTVPAGSYDLRWAREPGTETVKLEVTRGKRVLASGKGTWASGEAASPHEALVFRSAGGTQGLAEIRFRNSAELIRVEPVN